MKKTLVSVISIAILATSSTSFAELSEASCPTLDLREAFGENRDQSPTNWCYAYSNADLISYNLNLKGPDKVSALDVASMYINSRHTDYDFEMLK